MWYKRAGDQLKAVTNNPTEDLESYSIGDEKLKYKIKQVSDLTHFPLDACKYSVKALRVTP